jgi:uncharacterized protein (DUF427 family)/glutaredoxin
VDETSTARVEVLWRPACPFCSRLRRGLKRAGVETVERNIWSDPDAAATVRAASGGDETVPTVVVGTRTLVNPSVPQVVAAVRAEFPQEADALVGNEPAPGPWSLRAGAGWTAVVALAWVLLALWRPTTNWHLAPVLLAAAWPWVTGQDLGGGERRAAVRLVLSGAAGFVASVVVTLGLARADLLRGPTVLGFATPVVEALVLGGVAAALAVAAGVPRMRRRAVSASAWLGPERVASSDEVVMVEGNAYFPASTVRPGILHPSGTRTVCPWKGVARYYSVHAGGIELTDAAWCYPHPLPFARRVKGRIAFESGVDVRAG